MTTDTMRQKFENWLYLDQTGKDADDMNKAEIELAEAAYMTAYEQGRRDLIAAMGEPVGYHIQSHYSASPGVHLAGDTPQWFIDDHKGMGATVSPLYRLPEEATK